MSKKKVPREKMNKDEISRIREIVLLVTAIVVLITNIVGLKKASLVSPKGDEEIPLIPEDIETVFYCEAELKEVAGIEYIEYKLTSDPKIEGYHVRPYPYLLYEDKEENIIFPLENVFTNEEYSANMGGVCILMEEKAVKGLDEMLNKMSGDKQKTGYRVETILAVLYTEDISGQETRECYFLKDGELSRPKQEICKQVLEAYKDSEQVRIDMSIWPKNKEEILKLINDG